MAQNPVLSPDLQHLLDELGEDPGKIHELWGYALLMLMFHDELAHIVSMRYKGARIELEFQTLNGQNLWVVRPEMSAEAEQRLLDEIRQSLDM